MIDKEALLVACQLIGKKSRPFRPLLLELLQEYGSLPAITQKEILELGPGLRFSLLDYLSKNNNIIAIGEDVGKGQQHKNLVNGDLLKTLCGLRNNSIDLIYSRRVLEKNSYNPKLLLKSDAFRKLRKYGSSQAVWENYPGAIANIIRCYQEIFRIIRPGAIVITYVENRFLAKFHKSELAPIGFEILRDRSCGFLSHIWVMRKPL